MKKFLFALTMLAFSGSVMAAGETVICDGTESTGQGFQMCDGASRRYVYDVTQGDTPIDRFEIGTGDINISNYTNICSPPGWTFAIVSDTIQHNPNKTPHGGISAVAGRCGYKVVWDIGTGAAIANWRFAFDHPSGSHDVDWIVSGGGGPLLTANWSAAVGMNFGPVHAPSAHPVPSISLYGLIGLAALLLIAGIWVVYSRRRAAELS